MSRLLSPGFNVKIDDKALKALVARLAKEGGNVTVGVHEDAGKYKSGVPVGFVAACMEFGAPEANVPERSFIRSAIKDNLGTINQWRIEVLQKILDEKWTVEKALTALGYRMQIVIQNRIKSNVPPPLKPATIRRKQAKGTAPKGFEASNTLIDTGLLLRSIAFKVYIGKTKPSGNEA